jgi:hypothetical protein
MLIIVSSHASSELRTKRWQPKFQDLQDQSHLRVENLLQCN